MATSISEIRKAATTMARRSVKARQLAWGKEGFRSRMREWGKMGGRPKGSGKRQPKKGNT
jgi:hypothetical protein